MNRFFENIDAVTILIFAVLFLSVSIIQYWFTGFVINDSSSVVGFPLPFYDSGSWNHPPWRNFIYLVIDLFLFLGLSIYLRKRYFANIKFSRNFLYLVLILTLVILFFDVFLTIVWVGLVGKRNYGGCNFLVLGKPIPFLYLLQCKFFNLTFYGDREFSRAFMLDNFIIDLIFSFTIAMIFAILSQRFQNYRSA
jgi:hypothetical protein